jgi:drug/metabolite transporter (DMT)-like permease
MTTPAASSREAPWLAPGVFILLGLIWGSSFMWIKIGVQEIPPATLVAWRMTLGAAAMLAFLPIIRQRLPRTRRELAPLAVMGLINAGLPIFLISWGELFVDSGTAAVLNSLVPIFSLILAGLIIRTEPVTWLRVSGLMLGFVGAFLLASRELVLQGDPMVLLGCGAVIAASISYAVGASYARHRIRTTHRYVVAAGTLVFAALYTWTLALVADGIVIPVQVDTLISIAWLGLLGSFVAYLCFFFLIERLGATVASMVTYVFPIVGVALGVVFLAETLDWRLAAGTALVLAGIGIVGLRYDAAVIRLRSLVRR